MPEGSLPTPFTGLFEAESRERLVAEGPNQLPRGMRILGSPNRSVTGLGAVR